MTRFKVVFPLAVALLCVACSSDKRPTQGSPEWLYIAARESYVAGDFDKAKEQLEKIEQKAPNPYAQRARAWRMVVDAGLAQGHLELAQAYADGWTNARTEKPNLARQRSHHQKESKRHALHLVQAYDAFVKDAPTQPVVLEFPFPKGSAGQVPELDRIYKGLPMPEEQRTTATDKMLNRGIVRSVAATLATADDSASAQAAMQSGRAEVAPARFLLAMATALDKASAVFDRKALGEPDTQKAFRERALDASKRALELKPDAPIETAAKKLQADVEKALKTPAGKILVSR